MATGIKDETKTGNSYIDSLLSGWRWDNAPVTYGFAQTLASFPSTDSYYEPQHHFAPVNEMMRQNLQAILKGDSAEAGRSMTLTPVSGFTNINLEQTNPETTPTDIRIGMSSYAGYGMAYVPGEYNVYGGADGDMWFGRSGWQSYQIQLAANGTYGASLGLWGVGKVLGLKHGRLDIPDDKDFKEYTVMSYNSAPTVAVPGMGPDALAGGHPEIENLSSYEQTFMMLDIAALQQMYGANYKFRSDDTVYNWSPHTGEVFVNGISKGRVGDGLSSTKEHNKILQTIWDGGGSDTYDLSNYVTDLKVSLAPGEYSTFSQDQRTYLGRVGPNAESYSARGNVYNALLHNDDPRSLIENAKGGSGHDTLSGNIAANHLWGNDGKDTLSGGAGHDTLDGGNSIDTATFSGARANYTITKNGDGSFTVADNREDGEGKDTLISVNFAKFNDQVVTLIDPSFTRTGTARSDRLTGDIGNDKLSGLGGNDRLNGEAGNDRLSGGSGKDAFVFTTALNKNTNVDTISDFNVKDDSIRLENAIFRKLTKMGELNKSFFKIGPKAGDANDFIVYNKTKGVLSYDADGSRGGAAIEFAKVKPGTALTHADFFVI
ncbi:M10 family metallopeptidase C-terminal domain-containing protein [Microvirga sp. ACRRW]|uniref:M10 family metallopeptidase C-terminal domain-containing protein n=1 Tax=Microvirga sp. ACRRW TaxID=2918205 RepID=UPI001EF3F501|nr:M10 family metallopeptidase C-terminal domain-containing protein [Microvirga sp. ACRRW]MCG7392246.1 M10 family metallopeptidase C-terminal domain-containing protein [Microvirga sp. ACRRW]